MKHIIELELEVNDRCGRLSRIEGMMTGLGLFARQDRNDEYLPKINEMCSDIRLCKSLLVDLYHEIKERTP